MVAADTQNSTADANVQVGWQDSPKGRGTLTLVYSCLITIFASTWTVLHLNVPGLDDGAWTKVLRKAKWMAITILFPEFILSKAVCDLRLALNDLREFDEELKRHRRRLSWTVLYKDVLGDPRADDTMGWVWSWKVDYGHRAGFLYRLLGLKRPTALDELEKINARSTLQVGSEGVRNGNWSSNPSLLAPPEGVQQGLEEGDSRPCPDVREEELPREVLAPDGAPYVGANFNAPDADRLSREGSSPPGSPGPEGPTSTPSGREAMETTLKWHVTQSWTPTHAYFANMGGILHADPWSHREDRPVCYALTGSKLSARHSWVGGHPLKGLVLSKADIDDKSKADWALKGIAILQITWLILDVGARGTVGLPITQLEVATIAFSVFAIATYFANWWKPKDVSRPIVIQPMIIHARSLESYCDRTQEFMLRLRSPGAAAKRAHSLPSRERIRNDVMWLEGDPPLVLTLMALSSLVFGSIHCLAWNFEFPSRTELIVWRVASLTLTVLPVIALGCSQYLNYVATSYSDRRRISWLLERLRPLEIFPDPFWEAVHKPAWRSWCHNSLVVSMSMPKKSRTWEEEPPSELYDQLDPGLKNELETKLVSLIHYHRHIARFGRCWEEAKHGRGDALLLKSWMICLRNIERQALEGIAEFWTDYEEYLWGQFIDAKTTAAACSFAALLLPVQNHIEKVGTGSEYLEQTSRRLSVILTISAGILYTAARLMILVVLFTCLRSTPVGVYESTPWTRFLPNVS